MATLSPIRVTQSIDRPRTAPARTSSVGILRTSSSSDCAGESPTGSPRSIPSNISFAPLPEVEPCKRRGSRPLGVVARSSILRRQRANLTKHSYPTTKTGYQYQQEPPSFDTPRDEPQLWPGLDDPQYALQMAMAAGGPEPCNIESPTIVYIENGEPQQSEAPQVTISVSTPKRNRSRKGSSSKSPNNPENPNDWGAEEGALHALRKLGTKDKDSNEGSGLKFWKRLARRGSTPLLPLVKTPNNQTPGPPTTATAPTMGDSLVRHQSEKRLGGANPPVFERSPSEIVADVISPSIIISPVEAAEPSEQEPEPLLNRSETSTAASFSPPTPEIQSIFSMELSRPSDIVPTSRPLAANGTDDRDRDTSLPVVELMESKRHSEDPYSQYERAAVPLTSSASL